MSRLDRRVLMSSTLFARLAVVGLGVLAFGAAASMQVNAQAPKPSPAATSNVRFEYTSIRRNLEAEQQRASVPIYIPVEPGRAQTLPGGVLRDAEAPVEILVIEFIDRPTAN